jgi:hypothetical protein
MTAMAAICGRNQRWEMASQQVLDHTERPCPYRHGDPGRPAQIPRSSDPTVQTVQRIIFGSTRGSPIEYVGGLLRFHDGYVRRLRERTEVTVSPVTNVVASGPQASLLPVQFVLAAEAEKQTLKAAIHCRRAHSVPPNHALFYFCHGKDPVSLSCISLWTILQSPILTTE